MRLTQFLKRAVTLLTAIAVVISMISYSGSSVIDVQADSQSELEAKLKDIEKKKEENSKKIKETQNDIAKEKEYQETIEDQIEETEEYIRTLTDLICDYNDQIADLEDEITALEGDIEIQRILISNKRAEIDENILLYGKRLRTMYLSGNDSVASIIMGATDFFDLLMKIEFVKRVAEYDNNLIQSLKNMQAEYEAAKLVLENQVAAREDNIDELTVKRTGVEELKAQWDEELAGLEDLYSKSKKALKELEEKKSAYKQKDKELERQEEEYEKELEKVIREKSRKEYMGDLPQGTFLWPLPGYYNITSHYGPRSFDNHKGIDIAGSGCAGAEITAANSGVVIKVNNSCTHNYYKTKSCGCGGGFGNFCMIDHGGGYVTLYGHAKNIIVKEGQTVKTGDVLGYVGQTGWAMGYHLHFEVRVNGDRRDPESFDLKQY